MKTNDRTHEFCPIFTPCSVRRAVAASLSLALLALGGCSNSTPTATSQVTPTAPPEIESPILYDLDVAHLDPCLIQLNGDEVVAEGRWPRGWWSHLWDRKGRAETFVRDYPALGRVMGMTALDGEGQAQFALDYYPFRNHFPLPGNRRYTVTFTYATPEATKRLRPHFNWRFHGPVQVQQVGGPKTHRQKDAQSVALGLALAPSETLQTVQLVADLRGPEVGTQFLFSPAFEGRAVKDTGTVVLSKFSVAWEPIPALVADTAPTRNAKR